PERVAFHHPFRNPVRHLWSEFVGTWHVRASCRQPRFPLATDVRAILHVAYYSLELCWVRDSHSLCPLL
ncbi:MAG: hypothetical protein ACK55Z_33080, partial [bacterium]